MKRSIVLAILAVFAAITAACSPSAATPTAQQPPTLVPSTLAVTTGSSGQNDLAGTSWTLVTLNGNPAVQGADVSLVFSDTQVTGAACNSYSGDYTASAGTISVQNVVATLKACATPSGIMDEETAYLDALRQVTQYQMSGNTLTLGTASNAQALTFTSATSAPNAAATTTGGTDPLSKPPTKAPAGTATATP